MKFKHADEFSLANEILELSLSLSKAKPNTFFRKGLKTSWKKDAVIKKLDRLAPGVPSLSEILRSFISISHFLPYCRRSSYPRFITSEENPIEKLFKANLLPIHILFMQMIWCSFSYSLYADDVLCRADVSNLFRAVALDTFFFQRGSGNR